MRNGVRDERTAPGNGVWAWAMQPRSLALLALGVALMLVLLGCTPALLVSRSTGGRPHLKIPSWRPERARRPRPPRAPPRPPRAPSRPGPSPRSTAQISDLVLRGPLVREAVMLQW
jgi:hypothetical protein